MSGVLRRIRGRFAAPGGGADDRRTDAAAVLGGSDGGDAVVVVGAGIGGLVAAMALADGGARVVVIERDEIDASADADQAFADDRPGVPQSHQTHGFLARVLQVLRDRFPEVLADLEASGGSTISLVEHLGEPRPGDGDLEVLVVRRSTLERVLHRRARAHPGITFRRAAVDGLSTSGPDAEGIPVVDGVRLADGDLVAADLVVACPGARADLAGWLGGLGVDLVEEVHKSNLVYLTRWYRGLPNDTAWAPRLFDHLPYVKVLGVPGDGGMLSVTLAVPSSDDELRRALADADRFDLACRSIPSLEQFFGPEAPPLEPVGPVRPMAGLQNRARRFVDDDGRPVVLGFHALGDAHTTTNPIFGRGASLTAVQALLLADAHAARPGDPRGRAVAYEAAVRSAIRPWFEDAVLMEQLEAGVEVDDSWGAAADAARLVGALFVLGADDPVLGRVLARYINLLRTPRQLLADPALIDRLTELASAPGAFDGRPSNGPERVGLLNLIGYASAPVVGAAADATSPEVAPAVPLGRPLGAGGPTRTWPEGSHPTAVERWVAIEGGHLRTAVAGPDDGPLVVLVHGFPDLAYTWRHQLPALADGGYRVAAYDQRGGGRSHRTGVIAEHDIHHLVRDLSAVVDDVGRPGEQVVVVGHDWGVLVAEAFAQVHPERVAGLVALSVRPVGRLPVDLVRWLDERFAGGFNYTRYFQEPGVADAELDGDVADTIGRLLAGSEGETAGQVDGPAPEPTGLLDRMPPPTAEPPSWLTADDLSVYVSAFVETGFTGQLNWYRNLEANWASTADLDGRRIEVPSAFLGGADDGAVHFLPHEAMVEHLVDLRLDELLDGVGHWPHQERPTEVNDRLLRFLDEISAERRDEPAS